MVSFCARWCVQSFRNFWKRRGRKPSERRRGERVEGRLSYRSGYYSRSLVTRVGKLELRVPQDRHGRFSTEIFERYQRSEKALVAALTQMYIQGGLDPQSDCDQRRALRAQF